MPDRDTVGTVAAQLRDHIVECTGLRKETNSKLDQLSKDLRAIQTLPTRAVLWLVGAILTAAIGAGMENFWLHQQTQAVATKAADTADVAAKQSAAIASAVGAPVVKEPD